MVEYAGDPHTELERKAEQLKWCALIETISYVLLFVFWAILHNVVGTKVMGFFHGWIFLAFATMVVFIARPMHWSWKFVLAALVTGPIGGVLVYERIRRAAAPDPAPVR
jgi:glucan phosphoethanolaminetransferase (alkaline phosphatase superfamily)